MSIKKRIGRLEHANTPREPACRVILNEPECKGDCDLCGHTPVVSAVPGILLCKPKAEVNHESE